MMADEGKRKGLGRGLSALLEEDAEDFATIDRMRAGRDVPIEQLEPNPYQPRRRFAEEELNGLVQSIEENGVLQPILVRRAPDDGEKYQIIAGERRWRAAQQAKLHEVPVTVKDVSDAEALELAILENVQREDLTALEEAMAYQKLIADFAHTQEQLARIVGKSRSHIANSLRLLTLPDAVKGMLQDGRLTAGHARTLIGTEDPTALADRIVSQQLNVRQAERLGKQGGGKAKRTSQPAAVEKDADTLALERDLTNALGLKVSVNHRADEGGEVRITYGTLEQLDEICRRLIHNSGTE